MELKEIVKMVKEAAMEAELSKVSHDMILDCATRIFNSENINQEKAPKEFDNKPTQKQVNFLKGKKYDIPVDMTFEEAKTVIGEIINNEQKNKNKPVEY